MLVSPGQGCNPGKAVDKSPVARGGESRIRIKQLKGSNRPAPWVNPGIRASAMRGPSALRWIAIVREPIGNPGRELYPLSRRCEFRIDE